jgi:membrane associated rhomboid family serine protease
MGIYDRAYYGDDRRDAMDFFRGEGSATRTLILANVLVFILQILFRGSIEPFFAASTDAISGGQIWRLFTANFLHNPRDPFHLNFNMLVVWFAGRELEYIYGRNRFLGFYFGACLFSMTVWFLTEKAIHPGQISRAIGASGAAMAAMMLLTLHAPKRTVIFIFFPMELWLLMTIYVLMDAFRLFQESQGIGGSNVAFAGHLGGVLFGYLYHTFDFSWLDPQRLWNFRRKPKFRVVGSRERNEGSGRSSERRTVKFPTGGTSTAVKPSVRVSPSVTASDSFERKVDDILMKIAREGQNSLTDEERRLLEEASRRARSKRENNF